MIDVVALLIVPSIGYQDWLIEVGGRRSSERCSGAGAAVG
jgi:hypothetical protein